MAEIQAGGTHLPTGDGAPLLVTRSTILLDITTKSGVGEFVTIKAVDHTVQDAYSAKGTTTAIQCPTPVKSNFTRIPKFGPQ